MPIIKETKTPTGVTVAYHVPVKFEINLRQNIGTVSVQSYVDEAAAIANAPVAWNWDVSVSVGSVVGITDPSKFVEDLLTAAGGVFEGGLSVDDTTQSLESIKQRKLFSITQARLNADADHFIYSYTDASGNTVSKDIRTGYKDMVDLLTTNSYITLFGDFDADWPGGWKAIDNTYVQISTVDQWKDFFKCMYKTGIANFKKSQLLKAQIDAATTAEEVNAINW
jgi:hypothetical protein